MRPQLAQNRTGTSHASLSGVGGRSQAWALLCLTGCAGYEPVPPRVAGSAEARLRLEHMTRLIEVTFLELRVESAGPDTELAEAVMARGGSAPCRFGWAAMATEVLHRDGTKVKTDDDPRLATGDQVILRFGPELSERLKKSARLDILLRTNGREECVSFSLTDDVPEERWRRTAAWSMEYAIGGSAFIGTASGVVSEFAATLALGYKLGEARVYAGAGAGAAFCSQRRCPPRILNEGTSNERRVNRVSASMPLFAGIDTMPWQTGHFAFGAALEYDLSYTRLDTYDGVQPTWLHGPVVAPRVALTSRDPMAPGISGGPDNGFIALDFPMGVVLPIALDEPVAPRIGARLVISIPLE